MTTQYPAAYKYVQAKGYTDGRSDGPPLWIVMHTMQAHELGDTAESTANYFATLPDDRQVSSHLCIDNNTAIQCVDVYDSAWTVGNRPGNRRGLNYEHAGFAEQTATEWADDYSTAMLRLSAQCAVSDVLRFGIPVRRCTVDQLKAYEPGFTTHNDLRLAFGVTSHTDPGPAFPWSRYLDMVRAELEGDINMPTVDEIVNGLLSAKLGSSGPTVGVALQNGISDAARDKILSANLGSSGPTVAVALQTGAYQNSVALLAKTSDLLAAATELLAGQAAESAAIAQLSADIAELRASLPVNG
jgi:hypothetical protein